MSVATRSLRKEYGDTVALDGVNLTVPTGIVYGLVGPNGAGKTTLLGILAGLRRASAGEVTIEARAVGVLPDTPRFESWLTAREVVDLARTLTAPEVPHDRVAEVLAIAGLEEAADRKTSGYSRGMLQRLGLAAAVVGDPDVLLLDEPAAALDPAGRREVLDLVTRLKGRATVVFSSHILDDVQEVCDEIGVLRRGEMVYQGSLDGLIAGREGLSYLVQLRSGHSQVARALRAEPWVERVLEVDGGNLEIAVSDQTLAEERMMMVLASGGHPVASFRPKTSSLEQVFLEVTR